MELDRLGRLRYAQPGEGGRAVDAAGARRKAALKPATLVLEHGVGMTGVGNADGERLGVRDIPIGLVRRHLRVNDARRGKSDLGRSLGRHAVTKSSCSVLPGYACSGGLILL